jgi:hypothetical protein
MLAQRLFRVGLQLLLASIADDYENHEHTDTRPSKSICDLSILVRAPENGRRNQQPGRRRQGACGAPL